MDQSPTTSRDHTYTV